MNFQSPITHNNEKLGTVGTTSSSLVDINDNNNKVNIETTSG